MKWTDTQRIAEELYDLHGDSIDPKTVRFTQLRDLIMALPDFDDDPARCGERILEAVQQAWIEGEWVENEDENSGFGRDDRRPVRRSDRRGGPPVLRAGPVSRRGGLDVSPTLSAGGGAGALCGLFCGQRLWRVRFL